MTAKNKEDGSMMDEQALSEKLEHAGAIAREAGALANDYFRNRDSLTTEYKGPQDLVSIADRAVEDLIRKRFRIDFPEDGILGEEGGGEVSDRFWLIDPIDGTANFLRGVPFWCVALAYVVDGRPALGLVYDPIQDQLFAGRRGAGATCNGRSMQVSDVASLDRATVAVGYAVREPHERVLSVLDASLAAGATFKGYGSCALALALVADGRLDAFYEAHINAWDCLGGILLVEEAGGRANDFLADDGLTRGNRVLCTTPGLWGALAPIAGV